MKKPQARLAQPLFPGYRDFLNSLQEVADLMPPMDLRLQALEKLPRQLLLLGVGRFDSEKGSGQLLKTTRKYYFFTNQKLPFNYSLSQNPSEEALYPSLQVLSMNNGFQELPMHISWYWEALPSSPPHAYASRIPTGWNLMSHGTRLPLCQIYYHQQDRKISWSHTLQEKNLEQAGCESARKKLLGSLQHPHSKPVLKML